jgi:type I restriction enzyme S subunit
MTAASTVGNWREVRLSEICERTELITPEKEPHKPFLYVDVSSVSNKNFLITQPKEILGRDAPSRARKLIRTNDVIFATVRPSLKRVALVPSMLDGQVCSTGFCVLRSNPDLLSPLFLFFYLLTEKIQRRVESLQDGATYPAIRDSDLLEQSILLPSIPEQQAIARVIDTARQAKEVRQHELALERERKAALMEYVFTYGTRSEPTKQTEIGEVPDSWEVAELGNIGKIGNGSTPKRSDESYWKNGTTPWITSTQIHDVTIKQAHEFVTDKARKECHLPLVPRGSIVVAITGQGKTLGNAAILAIDACINQHLAYVNIKHESVYPQFVLFYLQSKYDFLRGVSSAGGSTKGALTCSFLKTMKIPIPPSDEQIAIAELLLACEEKCRLLENEIAVLDELFRAMLEELTGGVLSAVALIEESQAR